MDREMKVSFPGGLRVDAEYKGFVIKTDQPVYAGGDGSTPAPFDLFYPPLLPVLVFMFFFSARSEEYLLKRQPL